MSHKHESLLRSIFEGPVGGNVHWREVEAMLTHLGAKVEPHHGASFRVVLNGVEGFLSSSAQQQHLHQAGTASCAGLSDIGRGEPVVASVRRIMSECPVCGHKVCCLPRCEWVLNLLRAGASGMMRRSRRGG